MAPAKSRMVDLFTGYKKSSKKARRRKPRQLRLESLELRALMTANPFTPGDIVVYRMGDSGDAAGTSNATDVYLDEYTPTGTLVQSIELYNGTTGNGGNGSIDFSDSGKAGSGGLISLSPDGSALSLFGYDLAPPAASATGAATETAGVVTANGTVQLATSIADTGSNARSSAYDPSTGKLYTSGGNGIWESSFTANGALSATQIVAGSTGQVEIVPNANGNGNVVYYSAGNAIYSLGGEPTTTTAGTPMMSEPATVTIGSGATNYVGNSIGGFFFANLGSGTTDSAGYDTLYVADNTSVTGAIEKYSYNSNGTWSYGGGQPGTYACSAIDSVTGTYNSANHTAILYISAGGDEGNGSPSSKITGDVYKLTDGSGATGNLSAIGLSNLSTPIAFTNSNGLNFRGIALAPDDGNGTLGSFAGSTPYTQGNAAIQIDSAATLTDSSNFDGGNLTISGASAYDTLGITSTGNATTGLYVDSANSIVDYNGTRIGSYSGGANGANLSITFNPVGNEASPNASTGAGEVVTSTAIQALMQAVTFSSTTDSAVSGRSIAFKVSENNGNATSATQTVDVTAPPSGNLPTVDQNSTVGVNKSATPGLVTVDLTGITANGAGQTLSVTATSNNQSVVADGSITVNYTDPNSTGNITFTPSASVSGNATITVGVTDTNGTTYESFEVTVVAPPTISAPGTQSVSEDTNHTISFSGSAITDSFATGAITVNLADLDGTLTANGSVVGGASVVSGNGTANVTLSGTPAAIDLTLAAGVVYNGGAGFAGSDTLTITANDAGNTASGSAQTSTATVGINVSGPTVSTNVGFATPIGVVTKLANTNLNVTDPDYTASQLIYTLTSTPLDGTLKNGATTLAMTSTFTQADINAGNITYTSTTGGTENISFTVSDPVDNTTSGLFTITVDTPTTVSYGTPNTDYTQNFDSLANIAAAGNSVTFNQDGPFDLVGNLSATPAQGISADSSLNGWSIGDVTGNTGVKYGVDTSSSGTGTMGNSGSVFGYANSATSTDWALGLVNTSGADDYIELTLVNSGTTTLNQLSIAYTGELWHLSNSPNTLDVSYQLGGESFNDATNLDYVVTANYSGNQSEDGSQTANQSNISGTIDGVNWAPGQTLVLRFDLANQTKSDGLAIDNFSFSGDAAPVLAANTSVTAAVDQSVTISNTALQVTDSDNGDSSLTYTLTSVPTYGTLELNGATLTTSSGSNSFTQADVDNGNLTFVGGDTIGSSSFAFTVADPEGATVSGSLSTGVGLAPMVLSKDTGITLLQGASATITTSDLDVTESGVSDDSTFVYTLNTVPTRGTLELNGSPLAATDTFTQADVDNDKLTYSDGNSATDSFSDNFTFNVEDANSQTLTGNTFNITVTPVPTVTTNTGMVSPSGATTYIYGTSGGNVTSSTMLVTTDSAQTNTSLIVYTLTAVPADGTLYSNASNSAVALGVGDHFEQGDINGGTSKVYFVANSESSITSDSFSFTVSDGTNTSANTAFDITINPSTSVNYTGGSISQNFDGLANATITFDGTGPFDLTGPVSGAGTANGADPQGTGSNANLAGWSIGSLAGTGVKYTTDSSTGGTANDPANTTGQVLNYSNSGNATNQALGLVGTSSTDDYVDLTLVNTTGVTLNQISVAFLAEQWHAAGKSNTLDFSYSVDGGAFANVTSLDYAANTTVPSGSEFLDGSAAGNQASESDTITGLTWSAGETLVLRWNLANTGNSAGIAIDNFSFSGDAAPVLGTNAGLTVTQGAGGTIGSADLDVTDTDNTASQLVYTVATAPAFGTLYDNGVALGATSTFTQADINNNLLTYVNNLGSTTTDDFTFTVSDSSGGSIGSTTFDITVSPSSGLVATVPGAQQVLYNTAHVFSSADSNAISLTDPQAYSDDLNVELTATNGTVVLASTTGLTFANGTSNGQSEVDFSGTLSDIDTALAGLGFTPTSSYTGSATLQIQANDPNDSGAGSVDSTVNLTVNALPSVLLNEIDANPPGSSDNRYEYIELEGTPGQSLNNVDMVVFDGASGDAGTADLVVSLSGYSIGSDGLLVIKSPTGGFTIPSGTTVVTSSYFTQNGGLPQNALSFYLVDTAETITQGDNYDTDDNGTLAGLPSELIVLDRVGILGTTNGGTIYGGVDVTEAGGYLPDAVTRFTTNDSVANAAWYGGDLGEPSDNTASETAYDSGNSARVSSNFYSLPGDPVITPGADNYPSLILSEDTGLTLKQGASSEIENTQLQVTEPGVADSSLVYTITAVPSRGHLIDNGAALTLGSTFTQSDIDNDLLVYTDGNSASLNLANGNFSDSFSFTASDSGSSSVGNSTFNITITPVPTVTTNTGLDTPEGAKTYIYGTSGGNITADTMLVTSDGNVSTSNMTYTLTAVPTDGTLYSNATGSNVALTIGSTFTQNNLNGGSSDLWYVNAGNAGVSTDSFSFTVSDGVNTSANTTFDITLDTPTTVSYGTPNANYTENFDGLPSAAGNGPAFTQDGPFDFVGNATSTPPQGIGSNSTLTGWSMAQYGNTSNSAVEKFYTDSGNAQTTGAVYSVGANNASNRALGMIGSTSTDSEIGITLVNTTGETINDISIAYLGEQWLSNANLNTLSFGYSVGGTSITGSGFTADTGLNYAGTITSGSAAENANGTPLASANVSGLISGLDWAPGETLVLRWQVAGTGSASGLAIDNFSFSGDAAPVLSANTSVTAPAGESVAISNTALQVTDNDNSDLQLTYKLTSVPTNGTLELNSTPLAVNGTFTQADIDNDLLTFVGGDTAGSGSFGFTVTDPAGASVSGTLGTGVGSAPPVQALDTGATLLQGGSATISNSELLVTETGVSNDSTFTYTVTALPAHGTLDLSGSPLAVNGTFTQADVDSGLVSYTHDDSLTTSDSFSFTVADGNGGTLPTNTFAFTVTPVPTVTTNTGLVTSSGATTYIYGNNAGSSMLITTDAAAANSSDIKYTLTAVPTDGSLYDSNDGTAPLTIGSVILQHDMNGTTSQVYFVANSTTAVASDSFSFTVSDGVNTSANTAFDITINPVTSLAYTGGSLSQNFDGLANATITFNGTGPFDLTGAVSGAGTVNGTDPQGTGSNANLAGWSIAEVPANTPVVHKGNAGNMADVGNTAVLYGVDDGSLGDSGSVYDYGATGSSNRALGLVGSGGADDYIALTLVNSTGATLNQISLSYLAEQFHVSTYNDSLELSYALGAAGPLDTTATFTTDGNLTYTSHQTGANGAANLAATGAQITESDTITGLDWTAGETLVLRWSLTGITTSAGIAIDDFSFFAASAPSFADNNYPLTIFSDAGSGSAVGTVTATAGAGSTVAGYALSGSGADNFSVDASGDITVASDATLTAGSTYTLTDTVTDADGGTATTSVAITVDGPPSFAEGSYPFTTSPIATSGTVVGTVAATAGTGSTITGDALTGSGSSNFSVDASGHITVASGATLAAGSTYTLTDTVTDADGGTATTEIDVTVDGLPSFANTNYPFTISSAAASGTSVGTVAATAGTGSTVFSYALSGTGSSDFAVDGSGAITVAADTLSLSSYTLTETVTDADGATATTDVDITATVNHPPVIAAQSFKVNTSPTEGLVIGTVAASDPDAGQTLTYSILSVTPTSAASEFTINSTTGVLSASTSALTAGAVTLDIQVTDNGTPSLSADANVTVTASTTARSAPIISSSTAMFTVSETTSKVSIGSVTGIQAYSTQVIKYSLSGADAADFTINSTTGAVINAKTLDFQVAQTTPYTFNVVMTDSKSTTAVPLVSTVAVTVNLTDVAPVVTAANAAAAQVLTDKKTVLPLAKVIISDIETTDVETVTITPSSGADGTWTTAGLTAAGLNGAAVVTLDDSTTQVVTIEGTAANVTKAIQKLVYTPTPNQVLPGDMVNTSFAIVANDGTLSSPTNTTASIEVLSVNDLPTIVIPTNDNNPTSKTVPDTTGETTYDETTTVNSVSYNAPIDPFVVTLNGVTNDVTIADPDVGQSLTVTVTIPDANGTLAGGGFGAGMVVGKNTVYSYTATYTAGETAAEVSADATAALDALVFTPAAHQVAPGKTVTTAFIIGVSDGSFATNGSLNKATTNSSTTVITTAVNDAPTITGTDTSDQAITDESTRTPFASATIADPDYEAKETVMVTFDFADGTLADPKKDPTSGLNLPASFAAVKNSVTKLITGYEVTGTVAAVTEALDDLIFTPTKNQAEPGDTVTTNFTITATDTGTAGQNGSDLQVIDSSTMVVATSVNDTPVIGGTTVVKSGATTAVAPVAVKDNTTVAPFTKVTIADQDVDQTLTVSVTLSDPSDTLAGSDLGTFTAASLSNSGFTAGSSAGTYTLTITEAANASTAAAAAQAAVRELVFQPTAHLVQPGSTFTTDFTISVTDSGNADGSDVLNASDSNISVATTAVLANPTISGTATSQAVDDDSTTNPFSSVTISEPNVTNPGGSSTTVTNSDLSASPTLATVTATITLKTPALGTLSLGSTALAALNTDGGALNATKAATGIYVLTGSASAVQTAIQALTFTPVPGKTQIGMMNTETFTIGIVDTDAGKTATAATATGTIAASPSVVIKAVDAAPTGLNATAASVSATTTGITAGTKGLALATLTPVGPSIVGGLESYTYNFVSATDGVSAGDLDTYFSISGTGANQLYLLAGKTLAEGTYTIVLSVSDKVGTAFDQTFTLTVPASGKITLTPVA